MAFLLMPSYGERGNLEKQKYYAAVPIYLETSVLGCLDDREL